MKVAKKSRNSSQPPSTDGLRKTNLLREPSGKPPGGCGQAGHKGTTLKRVAEPTDTVRHPLPPQRMRCHKALPLELAEVAERRQIIDMPSTASDVIEHCTLALTLVGAEHFCVIRSCLDTLRKQGHGMLNLLQRTFAGNPIELTA